ncbi:MAG TPA: nucleotidyltransferase [Firmicutes bacterium]|jgi:predicted nucleotidyltransferase|nr:nucleotidyltransferase [Bacillota bacterium]HBK59684.1 nucleotidyltransferase [Bacillota bacterium]
MWRINVVGKGDDDVRAGLFRLGRVSALEKRQAQRLMLIDLARVYVERVASRDDEPIRVAAAAVIGSVARGDFNPASDIDVIIVSEGLPDSPLARADLLYRDVGPGIEPKAFTRDEFERMVARRNPLAIAALTEGVVILDPGGVFRMRPSH